MANFLNLPCRSQEGQVNMCLVNMDSVDFIFPVDSERAGMEIGERSFIVDLPIETIRANLIVTTPMRPANA